MAPPARELPVSFDIVREKNLQQLKILNSAIFPIKFPDQLYKDCMACGEATQLAYHNDVLVGAVAARCEKQASGVRLYIATLGVLAPYRGFGIGTKLLQKTMDWCAEDANISEAAVHVHVGNDEAKRFYERAGFGVSETVPGYYKKLEPQDAWLMTKKLGK